MNLQNEIDAIIISASRPKLLPYLINSVNKYIFFHGNINLMLHEDFVFPEESKKVINYCKNNEIQVFFHNPAKGIGNAIKFMLNQVKTKYLFMMQDDWEHELPIDLSHILYVMDRNPHINCIYFNKRKNLKTINGYQFIEENYDGLRLCLGNQWPMFNGIWRTDFVKNKWKLTDGGKTQEAYWNHIIKMPRTQNYELLKNQVGCYIYGPLGYPRNIRHLGYTWAVKPKGSFARRKDGYGGNAMHDLTKGPSKMRAPWLPPEEERPMYLENKKQMIKEFEKNVNSD